MALPYYPPPPANPEVERLRGWVAEFFPVYEARVTPNSLILLVHVDTATLEERFDRLRQNLWEKLYVPQIRYERGEYLVEIVRRPPRSTWGPWVNLVLLFVTGLTTITAGAIFWLAYRGGAVLGSVDFIYGGIYFGAPLLAILGLHELAHFVLARHHHVEASLPYFLPVPPPYLIFGTFGAFISLREPIPSKKALLDIGAAGPLAGFAVAIPVTLAGLFLSTHSHALSVANCGPVVLGVPFGNLLIGTSALWQLLALFIPGTVQNLHPLALAGWVGLLVTAMNLLPAGQLDGGHVFRALFGSRTVYVSVAAVLVLLFFGVFFYPGWLIFAFLIFFLGVRHPPPLNDLSPLDGKRWAVGAVAVLVLVGGFVVVPIANPSGSFAITPSGPCDLFNATAHCGTAPPASGMAAFVNLTVENGDPVPYGFLVAGQVMQVVANLNGTPTVLHGAPLADFLANCTWTVLLPNGNDTFYNHTGSFSIPRDQYSRVATQGSATFDVLFENPVRAAVTIELSAGMLCAPTGVTTQSATYSLG